MPQKQVKRSRLHGPNCVQAVPFINEVDGQWKVNPELSGFFQAIAKPFAVVCVAGQYRTGKSFLLNRGILNISDNLSGFPTGSTVNAVTRGLWVYPEIIEVNGKSILVIDSEGTRSLNANADLDSKIVGLTMLLSTVFIYNFMGNIDQSALDALSVFASVSESVNDAIEGPCQKPSLVWVGRDFHLDLTTENGTKMEPNEYLEKIINPSDKCNDSPKLNTIRKVFPSRAFIPLVRPIEIVRS